HSLDRLWYAGVDVALHPHQCVDEGSVADGHGDPPAGHVVALRKRVKLDADVTGALGLKETHGTVTVVRHLAVGPIVADGDVVLAREADRFLEEVQARDR